MDFSVIVPTFNRPKELPGCLDALAALDYPSDAYEVIVVDDGSVPEARVPAVADRAVAVRVVAQPNRGPGAARNHGARLARGRWLAFTDDDCRPEPGWLAGLRRELEQGHTVLAGGTTVNLLRGNVYAMTSQIIVDAAYRYFNPDPGRARFLASNNMAVWRDPFLRAGGFDERFRIASEDRDLCDRWCASGGRIVWTPRARVGHGHDLALRAFIAQHYRYGRGAARHARSRAARGRGGLLADMSFRWKPGPLLRLAAASGRPVSIVALLLGWQLANTAGFVREWVAGTPGGAPPGARPPRSVTPVV